MDNPSLRVLIAENQYLIAMEVEQILLEALDCGTTIIALNQLEAQVQEGRFDVVVLDCAPSAALNLQRAQQVLVSGAVPVFLSAYGEAVSRAPGGRTYPTVAKPVYAEDLIRAVRSVLTTSD
ncbi:MAG: hypothetical protein ACK4PN_01090 [Allorhizobium sp.]